ILSTVLASMSATPTASSRSPTLNTTSPIRSLMVLTAATASVPSMLFEPGQDSNRRPTNQRIHFVKICLAFLAAPLPPFGPEGLLNRFANFLSPIGCILALYMTQKPLRSCRHCISVDHSTAEDALAARIDTPTKSSETSSSSNSNSSSADMRSHQSNLSAVCSILTCLCGPSLFASLPVADPHYSLSIAFATDLRFGLRCWGPQKDWPLLCTSDEAELARIIIDHVTRLLVSRMNRIMNSLSRTSDASCHSRTQLIAAALLTDPTLLTIQSLLDRGQHGDELLLGVAHANACGWTAVMLLLLLLLLEHAVSGILMTMLSHRCGLSGGGRRLLLMLLSVVNCLPPEWSSRWRCCLLLRSDNGRLVTAECHSLRGMIPGKLSYLMTWSHVIVL
uniref:ANK_REP_REGION domain-containing protein n=1 Tax=Macrostomum lignano TaxID=282301 RepID=A0A1I8FD27_9PLAT